MAKWAFLAAIQPASRSASVHIAETSSGWMASSGAFIPWLSCIKAEERVAGIEPAWPAWKAGTLPLSYTRETSAELCAEALGRQRLLSSTRPGATG